MKRNYPSLRLWWLGLALLAISAGGAGWVLHSRAGDAESAHSGNDAAATSQRTEGVICVGHVDVEQGVTSLYPLQPGRVTDVLVRDDEVVKAGTVLLRLDERPARFLVRQAEQDLKVAQSQLTDARKLPEQHRLKIAQQRQAIKAAHHRASAAQHIHTRKLNLQKSQGGNTEDVQAAEDLAKEAQAAESAEEEKLRELQLLDPATQGERAEADVAVKQARLEQAQFALAECSLRAPADGKVLRVLVGPGEALAAQPKQPAVQFCPNTPRIIRAEVEQEFASRVVLGQTASVQDDGNSGTEWRGKVVRISDWYTHRRSILLEPLQFNDVRTLECIIQLDADQPTPRIGQRVRVLLGQAPLPQ